VILANWFERLMEDDTVEGTCEQPSQGQVLNNRKGDARPSRDKKGSVSR
jgi:hypothetical protein